ncbi:hypothetical protein D3C72_2055520 [compost metagenome]
MLAIRRHIRRRRLLAPDHAGKTAQAPGRIEFAHYLKTVLFDALEHRRYVAGLGRLGRRRCG